VDKFNKNDQRLWDNVFINAKPEWIQSWKSLQKTSYREDCIAFFKNEKVNKVLDLGCGVGIWSIQLALEGFDVTSTDFSEPAIAFAKNWSKEKELNIQFKVAPVAEKKFEDESFDGIIASLILDNISKEEMIKTLEVQKRQLRKQGVMFALFNPFMTKVQLDEIMRATNNPTKDITSVMYTDDELKAGFEGFSLVNFKKYEHGLRGLFLKKE